MVIQSVDTCKDLAYWIVQSSQGDVNITYIIGVWKTICYGYRWGKRESPERINIDGAK